ncbi:MAG: CoA ester lyase [Ahrensia sp.]|nr:CoA ester lyase [Ahrensia sp.]
MRSALFVPGDSERKLVKGVKSDADALFIDLEDSVSFDNKQEARRVTAQFLQQETRKRDTSSLFVRVNDLRSGHIDDDLAAIMPHPPSGIVLPKSQHGDDVAALSVKLDTLESELGLASASTSIIAIITETALGTLHAATYRECSSRLAGVAWGAEDLSADIGASQRRNADGSYRDVFRFARMQTLLGAVAAQVQPLDTVFPDFSDIEGLDRECKEAACDGFTGKMAIHPAQIAPINAAFTPSEEELSAARKVVEAFEAAGSPGVLAIDGEMYDRPHLRKAHNVLARAKK